MIRIRRLAVSWLLICCWCGAAIGAKSWEVPTTGLWDYIDPDLDDDWLIYRKTYNKSYSDKEELIRRFHWEDTLKFIRAHNLRYKRGEVGHLLGENELADMAEDEIEKLHMQGDAMPEAEGEYLEADVNSETEVPENVDWREAGLVTSVKNQGRCRASWAFAAVGALEGQLKKQSGKLIELSMQNLIDCSTDYGNRGCRGGWTNSAFRYVRRNGGIDSAACYPYVEKEEKCKYNSSCNSAQIKGYRIVRKSEDALKEAVAGVGPIAVRMDANHRSFWFYRYGIYDEPSCNKLRPTHALLAIGYGCDNGQDYWTVKNSWGRLWGHRGYMKYKRNAGDKCGISLYASYPVM